MHKAIPFTYCHTVCGTYEYEFVILYSIIATKLVISLYTHRVNNKAILYCMKC